MTFNVTVTGFENIKINPGCINILEIDNLDLWDKVRYELFENHQNTEENLVSEVIHIFDNSSFADYSKQIILIPEVLMFDYNNKAMQLQLYKRLTASADDQYHRKIDRLNSDLNLLVSELINGIDVSLTFNENTDLIDFLKLKKIVFETRLTGSFFEDLLSILEIISEFFDEKLIIIYDVIPHLSKKNLLEFSEFVKIKESNILLVERQIDVGNKDVSNLNYYKIDSDLVMFNLTN